MNILLTDVHTTAGGRSLDAAVIAYVLTALLLPASAAVYPGSLYVSARFPFWPGFPLELLIHENCFIAYRF